MKITGMKIEKVQIPLKEPFKVAFATVSSLESVLIGVTTEDGLTGYGEAAPFAPVTGETIDGVIAVLELFKQGLMGMNPMDIEAIHAMMDNVIVGNGAAKCAVDLAMYDLMGKSMGQPVYKLLGGCGNVVQNDITIGITSPEAMAAEAKRLVCTEGYRILKIKAGIDYKEDIHAMKLIREAVMQTRDTAYQAPSAHWKVLRSMESKPSNNVCRTGIWKVPLISAKKQAESRSCWTNPSMDRWMRPEPAGWRQPIFSTLS